MLQMNSPTAYRCS